MNGFLGTNATRSASFPHTPGGWRDAYYDVPTIHAAFGALVELLGLYVVLVASTSVLPVRLRFRSYKVWMRTTLALWWVVVMLGVATYYVWYVRPAPRAAQGTPPNRRG